MKTRQKSCASFQNKSEVFLSGEAIPLIVLNVKSALSFFRDAERLSVRRVSNIERGH